MRRLLVISNRFPTSKNEAMGIFVKDQVNALKSYFENIYVISTTPYVPRSVSLLLNQRRIDEANVRDYTYENVNVHYTRDLILPLDTFKKKWGDIAFKKSLIFLSKINFQPDIIHAHFTWPSGYVAVKLGKEVGAPVIVTAHGYDVYDLPFRNPFWFDKVKWTLENANHIITVSKRNLEIITEKIGIPKEKVSIIPNGFDGSLFKPMPKETARKKLKLPLDKKIILTVGNLTPVKGHKYLIEAMKYVTKREKDAILIIIGSGKLKKDLENQIRTLKLENVIKLAGRKPHDKIPIWMNAANLFVLPSLNEGNPTVMFEALGVGLPFVGTAVGGVPEIITSEDYGLLCPPKDPECLAEKIQISLKKEWNTSRILNLAKKFCWSILSKEILAKYKPYVSVNGK